MKNLLIIDDYVFAGFGAKVIGGVKIEKNVYITAGAIVTRNVPARSTVFGINKILPYSEWKGNLNKSKFFTL